MTNFYLLPYLNGTVAHCSTQLDIAQHLNVVLQRSRYGKLKLWSTSTTTEREIEVGAGRPNLRI